MGELQSSDSVARDEIVVKGKRRTSGSDGSFLFDEDGRGALHLVSAILHDGELRRSALGVALLAALLAYGAGNHFTTVPLRSLASDLDSTYSGLYKRLRWLEHNGYVALSRTRQGGARLLMRVLWPETTPTKRRRTKTTKREPKGA